METLPLMDSPFDAIFPPQPGFLVEGETPFSFMLTSSDEATRTYRDAPTGLVAQVREERRGAALRIAITLRNEGAHTIAGLNRLDPLNWISVQPQTSWRVLYAHGGTTEHWHPPVAYRLYDYSGSADPIVAESGSDGHSSNHHLPLVILLASEAPDADGLFFGMEWSGHWRMVLERHGKSGSQISLGVKVSGLELAPGETLSLPVVHVGTFRGGPDGGTNALRRYLYEHVCARTEGKLVLPDVTYDHWMHIADAVSFDVMKRQADVAARLGVETFVVDASWFPGNFPLGVGNWDGVDPAKFPDGLEPLAEYVRSIGMHFGLWFEPERACPGTTILEEHPEWFVETFCWWPEARFFNLNLSLREAQDWVIEMVGGWIKRLDLRWTRWDYNVGPAHAWNRLDPTGKIPFGYIEGLYRLLDVLLREHPKWRVEGCAGGGRRIDLGTMMRSHTYWFSDLVEPDATCRYMQARANRFLPGHLLNCTVPTRIGQGDTGINDTSVLSRMLGKLAFDGDIASWTPQLQGRIQAWTAEFKKIRHLLVQDFFQLLPAPVSMEDWDAVLFLSHDKLEAAFFVFSGTVGGLRRIVLRGLDPSAHYVFRRVLDSEQFNLYGEEAMSKGVDLSLGEAEGVLYTLRAR